MTEAVTLTEDRVPYEKLEESIVELVELYGGEITGAKETSRQFVLPLRRGVPTSGGIECTLSWAAEGEEATLTLVCDRDVDAPKGQRVALLVAGVIGSLLFLIWPFFPNLGAVAWIGGAVAIATYLISLRKTSGGLASDFLARLAARQRSMVPVTPESA